MSASRDYIEARIRDIQDQPLRLACEKLLSDTRFWQFPASVFKHQPYAEGLGDHTAEVLQISLATASSLPLCKAVNTDVIIAGASCHDYGKIWDYRVIGATVEVGYVKTAEPDFGYTRHRWTVRHLVRSYHEFMTVAAACKVSDSLAEAVSHVILAHHGRHEWGSPVEPATPEALIVHQADMLSERFTSNPEKHIFRTNRTDWSKL